MCLAPKVLNEKCQEVSMRKWLGFPSISSFALSLLITFGTFSFGAPTAGSSDPAACRRRADRQVSRWAR